MLSPVISNATEQNRKILYRVSKTWVSQTTHPQATWARSTLKPTSVPAAALTVAWPGSS